MIFVIPFIMGAAVLATAAYGAVKGTEGFGNINQAKEIGERSQHRHEKAVSDLKVDWEQPQISRSLRSTANSCKASYYWAVCGFHRTHWPESFPK